MMENEIVEIEELYDVDPECEHKIVDKYSGILCIKRNGWFCY